MKTESAEEQLCSENTTKTSQTEFFKWFHELEGFGLRSERFYDDVLSYMFDEKKDCRAAAIMLGKWLEAAFEQGMKSAKVLDKVQN